MRKSGIDKPEGREGDLPQQLVYVWMWFCELTYTDFSPMQMQAFFALESIEPKQWEIDLLRRMWREFRAAE